MDDVTRRKVLGLLGLGARARTVVSGVDLVRSAATRGRLALVVMGSDVSRHSRAKVVPLLTAKNIECIEGPTRAELGAAIGKSETAAVGVVDAALANGIRAAMGGAR
ncbi:MAG TPA: L7Ae/L30e/S12e/Gadd45 family ribosomal protein [Gemmatimonadaceae bacterium]|nr:L7Ae/L30e/S12e/Gadd45 family ribosomal protein [Gemmatimonadaceae bacterium]